MIEARLLEKSNKLPYLFAAYFFITLGYVLNHGLYFHQAQLWLLFIGWIMLFLPLLKRDWLFFNSFDIRSSLLVLCLFNFILLYFFDNGIYLVSKQGVANITLLKLFCLLLFLLYFVRFDLKGNNFFSYCLIHLAKYKFVYLIILAAILRLLIISYSPNPYIDVFHIINKGSDFLLQGIDPYSQEYHLYSKEECLANNDRPDCSCFYAYLPVILLSTTVFKMIFGDVRFVYIFAIFGSAWIAYYLTRIKFKQEPLIAQLFVLLILYLPLGLFVLEQSWIDYLIIFLLYGFVFLNLINRQYISYALLGLLFLTKITMLIFLPFILKLKGLNLKKLMVAGLSGAVIFLPFLLANPGKFFFDTIIYPLSANDPWYCLSFSTLIRNSLYISFPNYLALTILAVLFIFIYIKSGRGVKGFIHAGALFFMSVFILRRSFLNYYFFIAALIILLVILEIDQGGNDNDLSASNE